MKQAVEQRGDGGGVAEELPPVVDPTVGGEHRGGPLVAAHDQLEQILGGGVGQLAHAEIVDAAACARLAQLECPRRPMKGRAVCPNSHTNGSTRR